jgi:hypothetical protein
MRILYPKAWVNGVVDRIPGILENCYTAMFVTFFSLSRQVVEEYLSWDHPTMAFRNGLHLS